MRRSAILAFVFSFSVFAQQAPPAAPAPAQPQAQQPASKRMAGDQLWTALLSGNKTYMAGSLSFTDLKKEREQFKDSQIPPVTVLACSDSRVPPELVFNQSLGALFIVRTAGNIADDFGIASIEFAILNGWTSLIVVLGHENCGAVRAALGGADPNTPALTDLARRLRMSFIGIPYDSRDPANVDRAARMNARAAAAHLLSSSKVIRDAVLTEQVVLVPAFYELVSGEVKKIE